METLVAGNVAYWSESLLRKAFGDDHIVLVGKGITEQHKERNITWYPGSILDVQFRDIFLNYGFDRVIYLSDYLTFHGERGAELEELRRVFQLCREIQTSQIVCFVSSEICSDRMNGKVAALQGIELLSTYYAVENWLPIKIIRIPSLTSGNVSGDYFVKLFEQMESGRVELAEVPEQELYFLDMADLAEFLFRLLDNWDGISETLNLQGVVGTTFQDLEQQIHQLMPQTEVVYQKTIPQYHLDLGDNLVRQRYGWFAKTDVIQNLGALYLRYQETFHKDLPRKDKILQRILGLKKGYVLAEVLVGWYFVECLNRFLSTTVQFRMIDVRLLFIVIMSSIYGMNTGLLTAFLEILSVGYMYTKTGINWQTLFYEPSNWVPFLLYLVVAAICGYLRYRNDNAQQFLKEENALVQERNLFVTELYREALESKNRYKKQIIGSRDSFGKIFDVVRQLDTVLPEKIFAEAITVLEDVLENHSIAIYSMRDKDAIFGRLEVCSQQMNGQIPNSIRLEDFSQAMPKLEQGEVWFNKDLLEHYPMYMAGVKRHGGIVMLIMVFRVDYTQIGMYYANLFRILDQLIESFFVKAWEYRQAIREQIYEDGTAIVNEQYFLQQLSIRHSMLENRIASYKMIKIMREGRTLQEMDGLLRTRIRDNDMAGLGQDGNIYLLLSQIDSNNLDVVIKRLENIGLTCSAVEQIGED